MRTPRIAYVFPLLFAIACSQGSQAREPRSQTSPKSVPKAPATAPSAAADRAARTAHEQNTIQVFRAAAPATVFVTQKQLVRDLWSRRTQEVETGTGTGFLWDSEGHVVTNFHVIAKASSFSVTLFDGSVLDAELIGGDPQKDIAVLKVALDEADLRPVSLPPEGNEVEVGQTAIAIGNPFGLDHTLTVGVVSALGRQVKGFGGVTIRGMIQTDASINPGNSGGPLLDSDGRLIGMNTMIYSEVGQSAGVGFAVPVSMLRRIVPQIIEHGRPRRVGLGVDLVSDSLARRNGIRGVVIGQVFRGGPAAAAGLRGLQQRGRGTYLGDVIVKIEDERIESYDDYYNALDGREPGDEVTLSVLRGDDVIEVALELVEVEDSL